MNHLQNQNIEKLRKLIYDNEEEFCSILSDITKIEIEKVDSIELIKCPEIIKGELFFILKVRAKRYSYDQIELYLKIIDKSQLDKTISYYWILIYEEEFIKEKNIGLNEKTLKNKINIQKINEEKFTDIGLNEKTLKNKINIQKINEEKFTDTFLLEIENNKTNILKNGTTVYITEFNKYLINKAKDLKLRLNKEEVLFIGIKNNEGMNNFLVKVHS